MKWEKYIVSLNKETTIENLVIDGQQVINLMDMGPLKPMVMYIEDSF